MAVINQSQIDNLRLGIDSAFNALEQALRVQVFAEKLPIIGDELSSAFDNAEAALHHIKAIKQTVFNTLSTFSNAADYAEAAVEQAINNALAQYGLGNLGTIVDAVVTGGDVVLNFSSDKTYTYTQALESDLGMGALNVHTGGTATASIHYDFDLGVGVDASGFYIDTSATDELSIDLSVSGANLSAGADIGFLSFAATDQGSTLTANLDINLKDGDNRLRLAELGNDILDAKVQGAADINIHLSGDMGSAAYPSMSADLNVDWTFGAGTVVNPGDDNSSFGDKPTIAFNNVKYDLGSFLEDFVKPVLEQLEPILRPLDTALSVLQSDIKVLKLMPGWSGIFDKTGTVVNGVDIPDGKITLLDFLKMGSPGMNLAPVITAMEIIDDVVDWVQFLKSGPLASVDYSIGSFEITDDIRNAATVLANAAPHVTSAAGNLLDAIANLDSADPGDVAGSSILTAMVGSSHFALPILENPLSAFGLLLGKNVDLFSMQLPHVALGIPNVELASIPILPALDVKLFGSLGIALDLAMGFDTRGLAQFAATGFDDYGDILNGFYLNDFNSGGQERPEITFNVSLDLILALDAWVAEVGGGGGITGEIFFDLSDQLWTQGAAPGRIYLDTMAAALADNPFGIFETSGRITAGLTAYAKAFGIEVWRINSPRQTLGSFSFSDNPSNGGQGETPPPPPGLGDMSGATLLLNIGTRAGERDIADKVDDGESFEVTGGSGVSVHAFGRSQSFSGVSLIQADGGNGNDDIVIAEDLAIATNMHGGAGDDTLLGGAATDTLYGDAGRDFLEGAGGVDTLYGGTEDDILAGGAGADTLDGGDGRDIATYYASGAGVTINLATGVNTGSDAQGDTLLNIEVVEGSSHNDSLTGGTGSDSLVGLGGNDELHGGDNNDVLSGNDGDDILDGGLGQDVLIGGKGNDTYYVDDAGDEVQENRLNEIDTNEDGGTDIVMASLDWSLDVPDQQDIENLTLTGSAQTGTGNARANAINGNALGNTLYGLAGEDHLYGHSGEDTLHGGADADILDGGADNDTLYGDAGMDELYGGAGNDTLDGGTDNDHMVGGIGDDTYYVDAHPDLVFENNDEGFDTVLARNNYSLDFGVSVEWLATADDNGTQAIELEGNEKNQVLLGNAGNNILEGRGGADALIGGAGIDTVTYRSSSAGMILNLTLATQFSGEAQGDVYTSIEIIEGSNYTDSIFGTEQSDHLRGIGGLDSLYGNGGNDTLVGGIGNDFLYGGAGNDTMIGGADDDTYYVDSLLDVVDESSDNGNGTDIIYASLSYSIANNYAIENLTITDAAINATGNGQANILRGNGLDNVIDGRESADRMIGGQGNDTYFVDSSGDVVEEYAGEGTDTIYLATYPMAFATQQTPDPLIDYTLETWGAFVENINVTDDTWRINITGNGLGNTIVGNARSNVLRGLGGDDKLWAGTAGTDVLWGGDDNDTGYFYLGYTPATFDTEDKFHGEAGIDTLVMDWTNTTQAILFTGSGANGYYETFVTSVGTRTYLTFTETERFLLTGGSADDDLWGGLYEDVLKGNAGNDRLMGGAGKGTYHGGVGVDMVTAVVASAAGLDFVLRLADTQLSEVVLNAGTAIETRWEGIEVARITTGAGNDTLDVRGLSANTDTGMRGYGHDLFDAGAGNDTFATDINSLGSHTFLGGDGTDTLIIDWSGTAQDIVFGNTYYEVFWSPVGYRQYVSYTSVERFQLTGGSANDDLYGSALDDILKGNAGNDRLMGYAGKGTYHGGAGTDMVTATIASAGGRDFVLRLADTQLGEVVVNAGTTIETRWQGIEVARLTTGSGNDTLDVRGLPVNTDTGMRGYGYDLFDAGSGNDTFATDINSLGNHTFLGGDGTDTLIMDWSGTSQSIGFTNTAAPYYEVFWSPTGNHQYVNYTSVERFQLTGGSADDLLAGGALDDILIGGAGSDRLEGGAGKGVYDGGDGLDVVFATGLSTASQHFILNLLAAQTTAQLTNAGNAREVSWKGVEVLQVQLGNGNDDIDARGLVGNMRIRGVSGHSVDAGGGDDTFKIDLGSTGTHTFIAGTGDDTLVLDWSAATYEIVYTPDYYEVFVPSEGARTYLVHSGVEHFVLTGGSGNDRLVGSSGYDELRGGAGYDRLEAGAGSGLVDGGSGLDLVFASGLSASGQHFVLNLAAAQSTAQITNAGTVRQMSWKGVEVLNLELGAGNDQIDVRGIVGNLRIHGQSGHTISAGAGDDSFAVDLGSTGSHLFQGGDGTDTLIMDWSAALNEVAFTSQGPGAGYYETFVNSEGTRTYMSFSSTEKFTLTGGSHNDNLVGGALYDELRGGAGYDRLEGGTGSGLYDGGVGIDLVVASDLSALGQNFILDLSDAQTVTQVTNAGNARQVSWRDVEVLNVTTGAGDDTIDARGIVGNLRVYGVGGHLFNAGDGNDRFAIDLGSTGSHQFLGGAGIDTLVLDWSAAQHDMSGGNGAPDGQFSTFVSAEGSYSYVTYSSVERFEITGNAKANTFTGAALDDILRGNVGNDTLWGAGGNDQLFGDADNDTLYGEGGNDAMDGGLGIDQMYGGLGDDTYIVSQVGDRAVELANEGIDTVLSSISYTLAGQQAENLTLTGVGNIRATGNSLDNVLTGNIGDNLLAGGAGDDTANWAAATSALTIVLDANGDGAVAGLGIGTDTFTSIENIIGGGLGDFITGNALDNRLDGGLGADQMYGGLGDDTYVISQLGDRAFESAGQGTDTVLSSINYSINGQYIENLTLTGTGNIRGTGNGLSNVFTGNIGNNNFNGDDGSDTMNFAAATSALVITLDVAGAGTVTATGIGTDTFTSIENIIGGALGDTITGNSDDNTLEGGAGNDYLDGAAGNDKLYGGLGDDTFVVGETGDKVYESVNAGIDTVFSAITHRLAVNVENLTLIGDQAIDATGNTLDNVLTGNSANNTLSGGAGNDTANFAAATSALSITLNASGGGTVTGTGIGTDKLTSIENIIGGSAGDTITGNALANRLDGGSGADLLRGGLGLDTFVFSTALNAASNVDNIADFTAADDTIQLNRAIFTAFAATGAIAQDQFQDLALGVADASDRIIYDSISGDLFYDADGSGANFAAIKFANLNNHAVMTYEDFLIA